MAALLLMAGVAMACAQQPEKQDATEAAAPATEPVADKQETPAADDAAKEECCKVESESTSEGNSSSASEAPASSAE